MQTDLARKRLADIMAQLANTHRAHLEKLKQARDQYERDDFIWHFLLQSFATMGRSTGWQGLIGTPENYDRLAFGELAKAEPNARKSLVAGICRDARVRMPNRKACYICSAHAMIESMGGPAQASAQLRAQPGRAGKIQFLMQFRGIGPKYARNIMMDVYHEEFRESIAIDSRIQSITDALGLSFGTYEEQEAFYLSVAHASQLNGWEMDRLLYGYTDAVLKELAAQPKTSSPGCA